MRSDLHHPLITNVYRGKVRDVYTLADGRIILVASDRISAFDVVLPRGIPHKGQVLSQLSWHMLGLTRHVAPNWAIASPDPNVVIGHACATVKVEMVVRGYLAGHAWRTYQSGGRTLCGAVLPEGMKENDRFPEPIITPSTKADVGHDEDITPAEILQRGLCTPEEWATMQRYALALFAEGTRIAAERGLLLVDTKYEFGRTLLCGRLCRAAATRGAPEAVKQGVRARVAHRGWLHGQGRSAGAHHGRCVRAERHGPVRGAV